MTDDIRDAVERGWRELARLLVGVTNEERGKPGLAEALRGWGFAVAGTATRPHRHEALERTVHWLDGETRAARQ